MNSDDRIYIAVAVGVTSLCLTLSWAIAVFMGWV